MFEQEENKISGIALRAMFIDLNATECFTHVPKKAGKILSFTHCTENIFRRNLCTLGCGSGDG